MGSGIKLNWEVEGNVREYVKNLDFSIKKVKEKRRSQQNNEMEKNLILPKKMEPKKWTPIGRETNILLQAMTWKDRLKEIEKKLSYWIDNRLLYASPKEVTRATITDRNTLTNRKTAHLWKERIENTILE